MKPVTIAFDVDGTLRCNCTETCTDPNADVVTLFGLLNRFKNTELYVWSGGGADYSLRFAREFGLTIQDSHCLSKLSGWKPDIAIDDIHDFSLGGLNLIVREK